MITLSNAKVGIWVRTSCKWPNVPIGTLGLIVESTNNGIAVAWCLSEMSINPNMSPAEINKLPMLWDSYREQNYKIQPPLRDWFANNDAYDFIPDPHRKSLNDLDISDKTPI